MRYSLKVNITFQIDTVEKGGCGLNILFPADLFLKRHFR